MDKRLFESLLKKPESRVIDFKALPYDFSNNKEDEDTKFIKDVLSFINTIRSEPSFIITGVKENNGICEAIGVTNFPDDAILQQKAMDKIWPKPIFSSYHFEYNKKKFGIIEFPIHAYDRPLVITKPLKSLLIDTVYIRRGSCNSLANTTEILNLNNWFTLLKTNIQQSNLLSVESDALLSEFSDTKILLSASLSKLLAYGKKIRNRVIIEFATNELTKYITNKPNYSKKYKYRIVKVPATPYEITIPNQRWNADQMIDHMYTRKEFREIELFFHYPILELEEMIENAGEKESLLTIKIPYKLIFPEIDSSVTNATIFLSTRMLKTLYTSIRNHAIKLLIEF